MELTHEKIQHKNLKNCLLTVKNMENSQFNYRLSQFSNVYYKWYPQPSFPLFSQLIKEFNQNHSEYHGSIVIDLLVKPFVSQPDVSPFMYLGIPNIWNDHILEICRISAHPSTMHASLASHLLPRNYWQRMLK